MLAQKLCKMTLVDEGCCVYKGLDVGMYSGGAGGDRPRIQTRATNDLLVFTITEKAPTRAFSWLMKAVPLRWRPNFRWQFSQPAAA